MINLKVNDKEIEIKMEGTLKDLLGNFFTINMGLIEKISDILGVPSHIILKLHIEALKDVQREMEKEYDRK